MFIVHPHVLVRLTSLRHATVHQHNWRVVPYHVPNQVTGRVSHYLALGFTQYNIYRKGRSSPLTMEAEGVPIKGVSAALSH